MENIESRLYSKSTQVIAIWGAILYFAISAIYLWFSTYLAANFADSLSSLRSAELIKGTLFMLVNATLFGIVFWLIIERLRKRRLRVEQLENQMVLLDRRALIGTFTGSLAHDMKNMICGIEGWLNIVKENLIANIDSNQAVSMIQTSVYELGKITERLVSAGQEDSNRRLEYIDPLLVIKRTLILLSKHEKLKGRKLEEKLDGNSANMCIDLGLFQQMLINLILNAAEASGNSGIIQIAANKEGNKLALEVHDNGPGIPESEKKNIFSAYKTSKLNGNGLGLLSVKACAEFHEGELEIGTSPLGGALFKVTIFSR